MLDIQSTCSTPEHAGYTGRSSESTCSPPEHTGYSTLDTTCRYTQAGRQESTCRHVQHTGYNTLDTAHWIQHTGYMCRYTQAGRQSLPVGTYS